MDHEFREALIGLTDEQLIDSINLGKSSFKNAFYVYYLDEAKDRGLGIDGAQDVVSRSFQKTRFSVPRIFRA